MKRNRLVKSAVILLLVSTVSFSLSAQSESIGHIFGLWSIPFKTRISEGQLLIELKKNFGVIITESFTIDDVKNVAFIQYTGSWKMSSNVLRLDMSSPTPIQWTAEIAKQLKEYAVDSYGTDQILQLTLNNAPSLETLGLDNIMMIRRLSASMLTISSQQHPPITFTRLKAYPRGGRLNVPKRNLPQSESPRSVIATPSLDGVKAGIKMEEKKRKFTAAKEKLEVALTSFNSNRLLYERQIVTRQSYLNAIKAYKQALREYAQAGGDVSYYPLPEGNE